MDSDHGPLQCECNALPTELHAPIFVLYEKYLYEDNRFFQLA